VQVSSNLGKKRGVKRLGKEGPSSKPSKEEDEQCFFCQLRFSPLICDLSLINYNPE